MCACVCVCVLAVIRDLQCGSVKMNISQILLWTSSTIRLWWYCGGYLLLTHHYIRNAHKLYKIFGRNTCACACACVRFSFLLTRLYSFRKCLTSCYAWLAYQQMSKREKEKKWNGFEYAHCVSVHTKVYTYSSISRCSIKLYQMKCEWASVCVWLCVYCELHIHIHIHTCATAHSLGMHNIYTHIVYSAC